MRTNYRLPSTLTISVQGGEGGYGGATGWHFLVDPCATGSSNSTPFAPIGVDGARGLQGPIGRIDIGSLRDDLGTYAFLFGRRGADRHLRHGLYFAKDVFDGDSANQASRYLAVVDRNYCRVSGGLNVVPDQPQQPVLHFSALTARAHGEFCEEVDVRRRWVIERINFFGFPREFYMYLRPDILHEFRAEALKTLDQSAATFWSTIEHEQQHIDAVLLQQQAEANTGEKLLARDIARLRLRLLDQKIVIALARMQRNDEAISYLLSELQGLRDTLEPMLEETCDFFCVVGQLIDFVVNIVSIANKLVGVFDSIGSFFEGISEVDFDTIINDVRFINSLYPEDDPPSGFENLAQAVAIWAEMILAGVDDHTGLSDLASGAIDLGKKVEDTIQQFDAISAGLSGPPRTPIEMLAVVGAGHAEVERSLLSSLAQINYSLAQLENGAVPVRDQRGAIGVLKQMHDLVLERLERVHESQRLIEDHLLAVLEQVIAGDELRLAESALANSEETARLLGCRTGALSGSECDGIWPLATASQLGEVRDETCQMARDANEAVLLFDYLYHRARDFVSLVDHAAQGDVAAQASHDFRRNLLIPSQRQSLARTTIDSLADDFIDVLLPMTEGVHRDGFCMPSATCTFASSADAATNERVIAKLLRDGRVHFDVGTPVPELHRQRVTNFDLRLHAPPPYRLGCDGLNPCPPTIPEDLPYSHQYDYQYSHDPIAAFEWDNGELRELYFSLAYPIMACEVAQSRLGRSARNWDCRELVNFGGASSHESVIANQLAASYPILRQNYTDPEIFGTSVRGRWTVDIRRTLVNLGADDGCYRFGSGLPLIAQCYPAYCLSPCFDYGGNRLPPNSGAPAFCGCYDQSGNLQDTTSPGCSSALPPQLTFARSSSELAPQCVQDPGSGLTLYEQVCSSYLDNGQLQDHGDDRCCTESGLLKAGLSANDRQVCETLGLLSDTACKTPDICYEICGPRCKAFKSAFTGFEYRIYWRVS